MGAVRKKPKPDANTGSDIGGGWLLAPAMDTSTFSCRDPDQWPGTLAALKWVVTIGPHVADWAEFAAPMIEPVQRAVRQLSAAGVTTWCPALYAADMLSPGLDSNAREFNKWLRFYKAAISGAEAVVVAEIPGWEDMRCMRVCIEMARLTGRPVWRMWQA